MREIRIRTSLATDEHGCNTGEITISQAASSRPGADSQRIACAAGPTFLGRRLVAKQRAGAEEAGLREAA